MRADTVILGSVLSEKAVTLAASNIYTLKVNLKATKQDIKLALKNVFGVDVLDVNTSVLRGKMKKKARSRRAGAVTSKAPNIKKAYIKLKQGQTLPFAALQETAIQEG